MENIDQITISFHPDQLRMLNWILGFLLFGIAQDLDLKQFKAIVEQKGKVAIGLSSQWLLLPLLTIGLILVLRPPDSMALGLLLVSVCPGGNISNYAVHLARANTALSVILTTCSTALAIVLTPALFSVLLPLLPIDSHWEGALRLSPADTLFTILELIVLPLTLGMAFRYWFPRTNHLTQRYTKALSLLLFLGIIFVAIFSNWEQLCQYIGLVIWIVVLHNGLALTIGYRWARLFHLPTFDARAISLETGIQNSGLGLILIFNFFDGQGGMVLVATCWGIWHLISGLCLASWWRRANN